MGSGLGTGIHTLESKMEIINGPSPNPSIRMRRDMVNLPLISAETAFGMGWRFPELQRLYGTDGTLDHNSEKIMLVYGNFKYIVFERNDDGSFNSPKGDYTTFQAIGEPFGGFIRTTKEGVSFVFDSNGLLIGRTDRYGRRTNYNYDAEKLSQIVHNNGTVSSFVYGTDDLIDTITDPQNRVTNFEHDENKNLIRITDPDGTSKNFSYGPDHALLGQTDKLGRATSYAYDEEGNVTDIIRPDHSTAGVRLQQASFFGSDLGTEQNPFTVGMSGEVASTLMDARGNEQKLKTNEFGAVVEMIDSLGRNVFIGRDEDNNVTWTGENRSTAYWHRFRYDDFGNPTEIISILGTLGHEGRTYQYMANPGDNFHRPIAIVDRYRSNWKISYQHDRFGNVIEARDAENNVFHLTHNLYGQTTSVRNSLNLNGRSFEYDSDGNVTAIVGLDHKVLGSFTYDSAGNVLTETNGQGQTTTFTYDSMNRRLTSMDSSGKGSTFGYDAVGGLTSVEDSKGGITRFEYDAFGRITKTTDPFGNSESFVYDGNGNVVSRTDQNGDTTTYIYDVLNRLTNRHYPNGTSVEYRYNSEGYLVFAANSDSEIIRDFDKIGRLTQETTRGGGQLTAVVEYGYHYHSDNMAFIRDSEMGLSRRIQYHYNRNNRLIKVGHPQGVSFGGANEFEFHYDKSQRRSEVRYPNGVASTFTYSPGKYNHLRTLSHRKGTETISSFTYEYDLNNYVTSLETTRSDITVNSPLSYSYDGLGQLASATKSTGTGNETFVYDDLGNRLQRDGESSDSTFNHQGQLANNKKFSFLYDKNGNMLKKTNLTTNEITEYTWNYENQLTQIVTRGEHRGRGEQNHSL